MFSGGSHKLKCAVVQNFSRCLHAPNPAVSGTVQDVKPFSEIPRVPEVPILASGWNYIPFIGKYNLLRLHRASMSKYLEYGPIVWEKLNRDIAMLIIYDYEDFEKVFRHEGRYPNRQKLEIISQYRQSKRDIYKNGGLLSTNGPDWQEVRSHVQPHMMKPKAIHAYLDAMDSVSLKLVDRIQHLRSENSEIHDPMDVLYKWALESIGVVALDTHLGCLEVKPNDEATRFIRSVGEIFLQAMKLEFGMLGLWKFVKTPMYRKFTNNMDFVSLTVQKYLKQANDRLQTAQEDHEITFLELLLSENKDVRNVTATISDMFLAGIDTTSTAVGMTLYHLARNPEAQEKAYQEIKSNVRGKNLSTDILNELRYLKACVKESMRLTPVVLGTARKTCENLVLSGYHVPAGTMVIVQSMTSGLLEKNFPEPHKFRPERFLRNGSTRHPFGFIPFGFGPRSCIGRRIAEQEMWTGLTRVLERFRVEHHQEEIDLITRLINTPDRPLRLQFFDR